MKTKKECHLIISLVLLCLSIKSHLSFGVNLLFANQSLSGRETIVSKEGNFGLGFFSPATSTNNFGKYYLGIWYAKLSVPTVVWVANRKAPLSDIFSSELKIQDGNLVIVNGSQTVIWSTNISSRGSSSLMAILLDDGNFKLIDGFSNLDSDPPLWQSFDYPTDTWLPGSKLSYNKITKRKQILTSWRSTEDPAPGAFSLELVPGGKECVIRWNRTKQYWTTGSWNGLGFSLVPDMRNYIYNYSYIDNTNESYITYTVNNPAVLSRFVIALSGQLNQFTWSENTRGWDTSLSQPRKGCEIYAYCGAFGICNDNPLPFCLSPDDVNFPWPVDRDSYSINSSVSSDCLCRCSHGFEYPMELYRYSYVNKVSGDCVRKTMLQCENNVSKWEEDKFWKENIIRLPEGYKSLAVASAAECESACLIDYSCTAFAYNHTNNCSIWKGKIFNMKKLSAVKSIGVTIYIRIAASEFSKEEEPSAIDFPAGSGTRAPKQLKKLIISIPIVAAALLVSSSSIIFYRRRILAKRRGNGDSILRNEVIGSADKASGAKDLLLEDIRIKDVPFFSLEKIMAATSNFSDANKLGQGGFGAVYKGMFPGGNEIAVKRLSSHSGQGIEEFQNEVRLIARLQHRNLVRLLGYCILGGEQLLLYEYMNRSLDAYIFDQEQAILLDWKKRFNIISGIARGLLYLHQDSRLRVIHRDLKTSNILLDEGLNPKIADFGLARILGGKETEASTRKVAGTLGYMSPEYAVEGLFSVKSDVFSYGVILLEILSGKRNTAYYEEALSLLAYAWRLWEAGKAIELIDKKLMESGSTSTSEVLKCINIGLLCVQGGPFERPSMADVVIMLGNQIERLPNPNEPAFVVRKCQASSSPRPDMNSIIELTVSVEEGR